MLSKPQIWLLKSAQRQAGIDDTEYRSALAQLCGVQSSTDPELGDSHLDMLLAYFEAIYWSGVDAGSLQPPLKGTEPFRKRGFWAQKNKAGNTSRDRFTKAQLAEQIISAECTLTDLGASPAYIAAIRNKVCQGHSDCHTFQVYLSALHRTIKSRLKKAQGSDALAV
jgi:hypothetical protein